MKNVFDNLLTRDVFYKKTYVLLTLLRSVNKEMHKANNEWVLKSARRKSSFGGIRTKIMNYDVKIWPEHKFFMAYVPALDISDFGTTLNRTKRNIKRAIKCHLCARG